jgi:hypothetical protein
MSEGGPFDRMLESSAKDRQARLILIGMGIVGLILLILVLPPISLLSNGGGSDLRPVQSGAGLARAPEGFEALSGIFTLQQERGTQGPYALTLKLAEPQTDGRNLAVYTNRAGRWERVASATLTNNGTTATAEVAQLPPNVAVFRRTSASAVVSGWLRPGTALDPAAADLLGALHPVDYTPTSDGGIAGAPSAVQPSDRMVIIPAVRSATQADVEAVNAILASRPLLEAHIEALVGIALQPGNSGVEIDYRFVAPARKPDFTAFVSELANRLHQANKQLTLTLPSPARTGVTWDTGAYDWEALARVADSIKLVPEQDPQNYYRRMEEVIGHLRPKVDLKKVVLVVSRQSKEKGSDGVKSLSLLDALTVASQIEVRTGQNVQPNSSVIIVGKNIYQNDGATGLRWDGEAFAVSFSYPGQGGLRTVYLENSLSLAFRMDFARRYGLGGIAIDDVSIDPRAPAFWDTIRHYIEAGSVPLAQANGTLLRPVWRSEAGTLEAGTKGDVIWKAPAQPGPYDVSLIISDGVILVSQKVLIEVRPQDAAPAPTPTRAP